MTGRMSIWIGFDSREVAAFAVARHSIRRHLGVPIPIFGLVLSKLKEKGLYRRPMEWRHENKLEKPIMWDTISDAPMSTEFSNSRFLVPFLARSGLAMFMDCDMLVTDDLWHAFSQANDKYAVTCVKHKHRPTSDVKMDGQLQTKYSRKNWSSLMIFNCDHPANKRLTIEMVNELPGRDLHRLCWLQDDEIGELGPEWNYLVGTTDQSVKPKVIHHTEGGPWMHGYENVEYANEWRAELDNWAAAVA